MNKIKYILFFILIMISACSHNLSPKHKPVAVNAVPPPPPPPPPSDKKSDPDPTISEKWSKAEAKSSPYLDDKLYFERDYPLHPSLKSKDATFPEKVVKLKGKVGSAAISNSDEVTPGRLLYKIPDTINIKKTYTIKIRIDRDTLDKRIYIGMPNGTVDTIIRTTRKMMVVIVDPLKSFDIVRGTDSIQLIDDTNTEWIYDITPIKSGKLKLYVSVAIIEDDARKDIVYTDTIYVKSSVVYTITDFFKLYWQWIISTIITSIITPIVIWMYKNRRGRKVK